jgi:hypothetical protein
MNNIIVELNQFAQNKKLCAVYFQSSNGLSNLNFHYLILHKGKWVISFRTLNDEKFFKSLYKSKQISKNELLEWIHLNIKKEKYIHTQGRLDIIITEALI